MTWFIRCHCTARIVPGWIFHHLVFIPGAEYYTLAGRVAGKAVFCGLAPCAAKIG
jgi:hypothetical protein